MLNQRIRCHSSSESEHPDHDRKIMMSKHMSFAMLAKCAHLRPQRPTISIAVVGTKHQHITLHIVNGVQA
jgi:hypothetical protein